MAKVEIDLDVFMNAMRAALEASQVKPIKENYTVETPPKKKRGRPKKNKSINTKFILEQSVDNDPQSPTYSFDAYPNLEPIPDDDVLEHENTPPVSNRRKFGESYIAQAKSADFDKNNKRKAKTQQFQKPEGPNKFDLMGLQTKHKRDSFSLLDPSKPIEYPEPCEPRPPAQKNKYRCDGCNRNFEAYPGEVASAFSVEDDPIPGEEVIKPYIYCDNCQRKPR